MSGGWKQAEPRRTCRSAARLVCWIFGGTFLRRSYVRKPLSGERTSFARAPSGALGQGCSRRVYIIFPAVRHDRGCRSRLWATQFRRPQLHFYSKLYQEAKNIAIHNKYVKSANSPVEGHFPWLASVPFVCKGPHSDHHWCEWHIGKLHAASAVRSTREMDEDLLSVSPTTCDSQWLTGTCRTHCT